MLERVEIDKKRDEFFSLKVLKNRTFRRTLKGFSKIFRSKMSYSSEMENILHITTGVAWAKAKTNGEYRASSLETQGFIHGSFRSQVVPVANYIFKMQSDLVLLELDPGKLNSPVKLEDLLNEGELFPHIYGPINIEAVVAVHPFNCSNGGSFELPRSLL